MTFQAAHTWLRQTRAEYPSTIDNLTLEQEGMKSHVLQMCPHYERLEPVLAAYVNYDDHTASASASQSNEASATSSSDVTVQVGDDVDNVGAKSLRRQNVEAAVDDSIDDETKAQKRRLFELECARLQSEIETRNVQLVLEKTLARKKLLDAGISAEEVDRIFPL
ncbi:unnamed protein product [Phytophthora lilii]|uniref:Unnamed protein product n=1 Tax=Phytophthora lilii TaxID=2077276 RepID=A0A9W6XBB6_9STRA|nr:unnamed protein product [Phytophthora lilii]